MKNITLLLYFLFSLNTFSQDNLCRTSIWNNAALFQKNELNKYTNNDFSVLWNKTENKYVYGVIGDNYQRILIKFISIKRNDKNKNEYIVNGKSQVKSNICDFAGTITITKIQELKKVKFGLDDEYKNSGIKSQGLLVANYKFVENKNQKNTGEFQGKLATIFYVDKNGFIKYDDIEIHKDSYFNNAFVGTWKSNNSGKEKVCNWGDYRVPNTNCDFDIGAGELSISKKYIKNGWVDEPHQKWWK
ncbi:hypothetical protein NJT12_14345 [Flavobacterium sp. AC]|uniref:WG repeat-containing protein n=1 Tax=Flavobacterium azizsancarii TaxID=2961580 RepID=A0ABT4WF97_9FLAO|nr:hypothetical protein [Flavobacterium azizsancarii]MDA6070795.1 hypothetical protein [Flavobacterium azizsancarii]